MGEDRSSGGIAGTARGGAIGRLAADGAGWSTGVRLAVGAAGAALAVAGARRGGLGGLALGAFGAGLLARAAGPDAFEARHRVEVDRPVEEVFAFLTTYENYPRFLPNVAEARDDGGGRHRWTLLAPGGLPVRVRDHFTQYVPNAVAAWESEPGSMLRYAGHVDYLPTAGGGTRVDAQMAYAPPLGLLGHLAARLLGQDPGAQLDAILGRARLALESGRPPADARRPERWPGARGG